MLLFLPQSWKWKMEPFKISFLIFLGSFPLSKSMIVGERVLNKDFGCLLVGWLVGWLFVS